MSYEPQIGDYIIGSIVLLLLAGLIWGWMQGREDEDEG